MLWCVAGFGVFTIFFGLSHSLVLSMVALFSSAPPTWSAWSFAASWFSLPHQTNARARERRGHDFHRRIQRIRPIRIRYNRGVVRDGAAVVLVGGVGAIVVTALWGPWMFPELRMPDQLHVGG